MGKVMIKALPASSHYNATFKLAKELKRIGHSIVYVGNDSFFETVLSNGFEYYQWDKHNEAFLTPSGVRLSSLFAIKLFNVSFWSKVFVEIANWYTDFRSGSKVAKINRSIEIHSKLLAKLNPDLVILDVFYSYQIPLFYATNTRLLVFQTKIPTNREVDIPPLCSGYIPSGSVFSNFVVTCLWKRYFILRWLGDLKRQVLSPRYNEDLAFKIYSTLVDFPFDKCRERRAFHDSFTTNHELIFSLPELNFRKVSHNNQINISPLVDLDRSESGYSYVFRKERNGLVERSRNSTVVYCSLGSLPQVKRKQSISFLKKVISLFRGLPEYTLVLSTSNFELESFSNHSKNVFIYRKVPQLEVLKFAHLMITHGGMQTITECVLNAVPMLVCPLNKTFDQRGNAARIHFHRLGIIGSVQDSQQKIRKNIVSLSTSKIYKMNLQSIRNRINESDRLMKGLLFVDQYMKAESMTETTSLPSNGL